MNEHLPPIMTHIADRLKTIQDTLATLNAEDVRLIAVSKTQPVSIIQQALDLGLRHFGENRIQESYEKWPNLKDRYPDVKLHLIGHLQSNKVKEAVQLFDVIHTLDSKRLIEKLAPEAAQQHKNLDCFIQINTGEEPQKSGILPTEADEFIEWAKDFSPYLKIIGLMVIPPAQEPPSLHFGLLRTIAQRHNLSCLSMGMSDDYPLAIQLGATHIRLGTVLFGARL